MLDDQAFLVKHPTVRVLCTNIFTFISVPPAVMPPDRESDFDDHLGRTVRELKDLQDTSIRVFFCYTQKNIPSLGDDEKLVHPGRIIEDLRKMDNKV